MSDSESDSDAIETLRKSKRNAKFDTSEDDDSDEEDVSSGSGEDDDDIDDDGGTNSSSDFESDTGDEMEATTSTAAITRQSTTARKSKRNRRQLSSSTSSAKSSFDTERRRKSGGGPKKKTKPYIYMNSSDESDSSWSPIVGGGDDDDGDEPIAGPSRIETPEKNAEVQHPSSPDESSSSTDSNDENEGGGGSASEKCPICLHRFRGQEIGQPAVCSHSFCAPCIEEWSNNVQTCPIDRLEFNEIIVRSKFGPDGQAVRRIPVIVKKSTLDAADTGDDLTPCEVCRHTDREDTMLLCDGCNRGYHMACLTPPLLEIPQNSWYCDYCFASENSSNDEDDVGYLIAQMEILGVPETRLRVRRTAVDAPPRILRTRQSERIRATILSRIAPSRRHAPVGSLETALGMPLPGTYNCFAQKGSAPGALEI